MNRSFHTFPSSEESPYFGFNFTAGCCVCHGVTSLEPRGPFWEHFFGVRGLGAPSAVRHTSPLTGKWGQRFYWLLGKLLCLFSNAPSES